MASRRNAMSRVKKRMKKARVERRVHSTKIVVKMNQPARKKPKALVKSAGEVYDAAIARLGVLTKAKAIQKPPYEDRAVAPKVFPTAISLRSVRDTK